MKIIPEPDRSATLTLPDTHIKAVEQLGSTRHDKVKRLVQHGVNVQPPMVDEQILDAMGRPRTTSIYRIGKRDSSPPFTTSRKAQSSVALHDSSQNRNRVMLLAASAKGSVKRGSPLQEALGYSDPHHAIRRFCRGVGVSPAPSKGGIQTVKIIPERDVYRLIMRSKLPTD